ncbi:atp-dependent RNA helicase, partial [Reticulomyxa filosa]
KGENLVGAAKTGSGKTLAFLIPLVDKLTHLRWDCFKNGVGAIVITPTRELAIQIHTVCKAFVSGNPDLKIGLLIGGNPKPSDHKHILDGIDICIATPGRLLDHMMV